jgi:predicted ATPase
MIGRMLSPFISRVQLKSYKSIAICDIPLNSLTFLVGPNGSGKSNFLDALRFVADSLRRSLDHALRERGGIAEVRRRSAGHPNHFAIRLDVKLRDGTTGHYSFRIGARPQGGFEVQNEECMLQRPEGAPALFHVRKGTVAKSTSPTPPPASPDRLYLVNAAGLPEFRPIYDALSHMGFYSLNPDRIRDLQTPDPGDLLARDGSNIASVLAQMSKRDQSGKDRIENYLGKVVPGVEQVEPKVIGPKETLEFRQKVAGSTGPWRFLAANMSDGTLRSLGVLVSLFQSSNGDAVPISLVGIEEPESALHPAAARVLLDSILAASSRTQVIVTSHSPDLLDYKELPIDSILAVLAEEGETHIAHLDEGARGALSRHLYTAGELLRLDQLQPDRSEIERVSEQTMRLFDEPDAG